MRKEDETDLSVCKDCGIVALEAAFDKLLSAVVVDGFLLGVHVKDMVVGEGLVFAQDHLRLPGHHKRTDVTALDLLFGQLRTDPGRQKDKKTMRFVYYQPRFPLGKKIRA